MRDLGQHFFTDERASLAVRLQPDHEPAGPLAQPRNFNTTRHSGFAQGSCGFAHSRLWSLGRAVLAGLLPAIPALASGEEAGWPRHKAVYAGLRRALRGHDLVR
jgi:hypothetical protein